jgi:nitrile hydratase
LGAKNPPQGVIIASEFTFTDHADDAWVTANGANMVARAWTDPEFRARMLADGTAAAREMGFDFPEHHRHLVALENTLHTHNVIVCTLCSCTAYEPEHGKGCVLGVF